MNRALLLVLTVELILLFLSWVLLVRPRFLVGVLEERRERIYFFFGAVSLSLFFSWSFILGAMLALGRVTFWPLIQNP